MCIDISFVVPFLKNAAPQIIGSMLSALVALLIFYLGQRLTRMREKEKEAKRLADVREYFYVSLLRLKKGIDLQLEISAELVLKLENDDKENNGLFRDFLFTYDLFTETILGINRNDVFKFFIIQKETNKSERIRLYSSFYGAVEALAMIIKEDHQRDTEIMSKYHNAEVNISAYKDELINKLISAAASGINGLITDKYYVAFNEIFTKHQKVLKTVDIINIDGDMKSFIYPISQMSHTYLFHKDASFVINICQQADADYRIILNDKLSKRRSVLHAMMHYAVVKDLISEVIKIEFSDFN